jgi:type IV secretory pathway TrbL component
MEERNAADPPSPKPANGIKKAYSKSNLSHSTLSERDDSALSSQNSRTPSFDEAGKEKSRSSTGGAERDAAPSGLSKLMPGARRRLRKKQEAEAAAAASQESLRGTASHGLPSEESLAESDAVNTRRRSFTDPGVNPLGHGPESGG